MEPTWISGGYPGGGGWRMGFSNAVSFICSMGPEPGATALVSLTAGRKTRA